MDDKFNKNEFEKNLEELGRCISRLAHRAGELHDNAWLDLHKSWKEALDSSEQLQVSLITKALGYFDMALTKMNGEVKSANTLLKQVFNNLPEINEEED